MTTAVAAIAAKHGLPESRIWKIAADLYPVLSRVRPRLAARLRMELGENVKEAICPKQKESGCV